MKPNDTESKFVFGKYIIICSIILMVSWFVAFLTFGQGFSSITVGPWFHFLIVGNACISLYCGSRWAKWVICPYLFIFGISQSQHLLPLYDEIQKSPGLIFITVSVIGSIILSFLLAFSKSVADFVEKKYINRTEGVRNYLKRSWSVLLVLLFLKIAYDYYRYIVEP